MENTVTLIGNLVDDPELRFTPSGVALAKIRIAVNRRWRGQDGEWQEDTSFFTGTLWREQAESAAESLQKGARRHCQRSARAAQLGDRGRRQALRRGDPDRRDRPVTALGHRDG